MVNVSNFFKLGRYLMNKEAASQLTLPEENATPFFIVDEPTAREYLEEMKVGGVPFDQALYNQAKALLDSITG